MELSELAAYAAERYHIPEEHKWADWPGFSVLTDPKTGKWAALLMRQWDPMTGTEIQRCDIKCGRDVLSRDPADWLTLPFRMKGQKWVGVRMDGAAPEAVFRLLDRALEKGDARDAGVGEGRSLGVSPNRSPDRILDRPDIRKGVTIVLEDRPAQGLSAQERSAQGREERIYGDTAIPRVGRPALRPEPDIPREIRMMRKLYVYGDVSFAQKCRNFYRQGKFMERYEDDLPWRGDFRHYFPTYHDLSVRQLRGYFTWRTQARRGVFQPVPASVVYIYIYELLCGIGTDSPRESLQRLRELEEGLPGIGNDASMRRNLRRWMTEYAILNDMPVETARSCADPEVMERDRSLAVLRDPAGSADADIFDALCALGGKKLSSSPAVTKDEARGRALFASFWRTLSEEYGAAGKDLFTRCFGEPVIRVWHPLANTLFVAEQGQPDVEYELDACRRYRRRNDVWEEESYEKLFFDKDHLAALLHGADRVFRRYLKTGRYLKAGPGDGEAAACAERVTEAEEKALREAARPVVHIDLSGLERIRQDAMVTRDSLLTEEELREPAEASVPETADSLCERPAEVPAEEPAAASAEQQLEQQPAGCREERTESGDMPEQPASIGSLDELHMRILTALLRGGSSADLMAENHLMPSVVADTINEALFDEIGDSVLECEDDRIGLVEEYAEDVRALLGQIG